MRTETVYTTQDGQRHNTPDDARRHADKVYGIALSNLSHTIIREADFSYRKLMDFLDGNLDEFIKLKALKQDAETWEGEENRYVWKQGENGRRGEWVTVNS